MTSKPKPIRATSGIDSAIHPLAEPSAIAPTIPSSSAYDWTGKYVIAVANGDYIGYVNDEVQDQVSGLFMYADQRLIHQRYAPAVNGWIFSDNIRLLTASDIILNDLHDVYTTLQQMVSECQNGTPSPPSDFAPKRKLNARKR